MRELKFFNNPNSLRLTVENNFTTVEGESYAISIVREILSFDDPELSLLDDHVNTFLTGLLPVVRKGLKDRDVAYQVIMHAKLEPDLISDIQIPTDYLEGIVMRDYQCAAAVQTIRLKRGIDHIATRGGKTEIAAAVIKYLQLPTLFLVNLTGLMQQTYDRFVLRGFKEETLSMVGGGHKTNESAKFFVATSQTVIARLKKNDPFIINLLKSVRILILDEAQFTASKGWMRIAGMCENADYRIALSGTPFTTIEQNSMRDRILRGVTGEVIVTIPYQWLESQGYVSSAEVHVVQMMNKPIPHTDLDGNSHSFINNDDWHQVYKEGIAWNHELNRSACALARQYREHGRKVILLVREHIHAQNLMRMFFQEFDELVYYSAGGESYYYHDGSQRIVAKLHNRTNPLNRILEALESFEDPDNFSLQYTPTKKGNSFSLTLDNPSLVGAVKTHLVKNRVKCELRDYHRISKSMKEVIEEYAKKQSFILIGSPIYKYGADLPYLDTVLNLAAGRALVPTIQAVSRGTTAIAGKDKCIILDWDLEYSFVLSAQLKKRVELYKSEGYDVHE